VSIWPLSRATDRSLTTRPSQPADPFRYPCSHAEWVDWYQYRIDAYHGENYTEAQIKALQLFRALDDDGKVIALTRRIHRDVQHVVDVAVSALALPKVTLAFAEGVTAQEKAAAERIWKASDLARHGARWAWTLANCGDLYVEPAQLSPGRFALVSHDPRTCYAPYDDALGVEIPTAVITHRVLDEGSVDAYGTVTESAALTIHQRTLTATAITVERTVGSEAPSLLKRTESKVDEAASGPHRLGVNPLVHIPCLPSGEPDHGLWVGHALDRALAEVDSLASQISAIGDRYANPKLVVIGAKVADDSAVGRFGRIINLHGSGADKAEVKYLEADLSGVDRLAERIEATLAAVRATLPEFLLFGSTANLSGEALRLLSTRYVAKYEDIRGRLYGGLATALHRGVDLALKRPHDPDRTLFTLEGPPLLPADKAAEVATIKVAKDANMVSEVDAVRHSQRLGIASKDQSPEDYAADLMDRAAERAAGFFSEGDLAAEETPAAEGEAASVDAVAGVEAVADTGLSGAQMTGIQQFADSVYEGRQDLAGALAGIRLALPTADPALARAYLEGALRARRASPPPTRAEEPLDLGEE
jgi:hypothetical protein